MGGSSGRCSGSGWGMSRVAVAALTRQQDGQSVVPGGGTAENFSAATMAGGRALTRIGGRAVTVTGVTMSGATAAAAAVAVPAAAMVVPEAAAAVSAAAVGSAVTEVLVAGILLNNKNK
ncbi:unnamed protein product [Cuscuta europaea]|uniref:Uncharacterized protein n=1 Tax=Cuscuta europaea TaxID=41803 RepID=A0A9P0ZVS2_CUSEU|nr:unnamed protein product [Cuscuta europaea]